MPIEIRIAKTSDAAAICDLVRRSITTCCVADHQNNPDIVSTWLENKTPENISKWVQADDAIAVLAVRDEELVGFALASDDELALCYAKPEALHQGIGKALLRAIESSVLSRGFPVLRLESTRTAQDFYARNGFSLAGPVQVWASMEGQPMAKKLLPLKS
jgi:GNAT superfamily N-acetyltransferase